MKSIDYIILLLLCLVVSMGLGLLAAFQHSQYLMNIARAISIFGTLLVTFGTLAYITIRDSRKR
jgi:ABC-type antimicrobial peptide transport system permease subunit